MKSNELTIIFFALMGFFILLFIALPLANMILTEKPDRILNVLTDKNVRDAILLSIYTATITTIIAFLFGVPLAYLLARFEFFGKGFVESIIDVPIVIPHAVVGIMLLTLFGKNGPLGISFAGTYTGIIIAMLFVSAPFIINSAKNGFLGFDSRLENVAMSLGASRFQSFVEISFPLAFRSILTGAILTWARAISEFGAVIIISYYPMTAPVLIYEKYLTYGLDASRPIAVSLLLISLTVFVVLRVLLGRK